MEAVEIGLEELTTLNVIMCPNTSDVVKNLPDGSVINSTAFNTVDSTSITIDLPTIDLSQMNVTVSIPAIDSPTVNDHDTTGCTHIPKGHNSGDILNLLNDICDVIRTIISFLKVLLEFVSAGLSIAIDVLDFTNAFIHNDVLDIIVAAFDIAETVIDIVKNILDWLARICTFDINEHILDRIQRGSHNCRDSTIVNGTNLTIVESTNVTIAESVDIIIAVGKNVAILDSTDVIIVDSTLNITHQL